MKTFPISETQNIFLPNKHLILEKLDALQPGESITVRNDHRMDILLYQLINDRGNTYSWKYLEKGPNTWRATITRLATEKHSPKIGTLAAEDYRKAELFHKFGIDYCCNGNKSLKQAFEEAGLSEKIWNEWYIESLQYKDKEVHVFENWEVTFLVEYIINTHHAYIRNNSDLINRLAFKVSARHGYAYPELKELTSRLNYFLRDLEAHINNEEQAIFPVVKKIANRHRNAGEMSHSEIEELAALKHTLIGEHKLLGEEIKYFRSITRNFKLPADACATFTHFYAKLLEFETDLIQHIHLENNILLAKMTKIE